MALTQVQKLRLLSLACLTLAATSAVAADPASVRTDAGLVSGAQDGDLMTYKGIPFAKLPIGQLRWKPPQRSAAWTGVKAVTEFAPACMQPTNSPMSVQGHPVSEDCLYLNIWSPVSPKPKAVLVWIHGGAFSYGSTVAPVFDGAALARKGIVVVSVAYRLGPFGFLAHPELSAESAQSVSGNYGLLDQIAALEWVKRNIKAFGGDPKRVSIMGESAGAMSVGLLAQSRQARGLFRGIIAQSGGGLALPPGLVVPLAEAEAAGKAWSEAAGVGSLAELRGLSATEILKITPQNGPLSSIVHSWPVRDGVVIPEYPDTVYKRRQFNDAAILVGSNDDEGSLFNGVRTRVGFFSTLKQRYGAGAKRALAVYPAENDTQAEMAASAFLGDSTFRVPQLRWAQLQALHGKQPIYFYHFAQVPPARPGIIAGAIHGAELPYMFNNQHVRKIAWTDEDKVLAETMSSYWVNFVKTGNPNAADLPKWPRFATTNRPVMWFAHGKAAAGQLARAEQIDVLDALAEGKE